jgi:hypothetical protein
MESVNHLFFDCCIAKFMWSNATKITGVDVGSDFEWLLNVGLVIKKHRTLNVLTPAVFWTLWKMRNDLRFQGLGRGGGGGRCC